MSKVIASYRDLEVWQKAMSLVEELYRSTQTFPREEQFGLTAQMRRAAVSVPSNIAEGHVRAGTNEYCHFLSIAKGSVAELETQILIAQRLQYLQKPLAEALLKHVESVGMMLSALVRSLRGRRN